MFEASLSYSVLTESNTLWMLVSWHKILFPVLGLKYGEGTIINILKTGIRTGRLPICQAQLKPASQSAAGGLR